MTIVYPVVFEKIESGYMASVPDFPLDTEGKDLADAIFMVRDAIGLMGICFEDDGKPLPTPSALDAIDLDGGDFVSLVDVDLVAYRRANDQRTVRRNVALPSWLDVEAKKAGINVSAVLQKALKQELQVG